MFPESTRSSLGRLCDALETVFSVRLEARRWGDWRGLDALITVGDPPTPAFDPVRAGLSLLRTPHAPPAPEPPGGLVTFTFSEHLHPRLRGRRLREASGVPPLSLAGGEDEVVLAHGPGGPVWTVDSRAAGAVTHRVSIPLSELGPGERLKDHLRAGRSMGLLPVVHLLSDVRGEGRWRHPQIRACLVIDDPNLHWPSFGHLRYAQLAARAQAGGYHVAIAMVPLDAAYAHRGAVELVRGSPQLSLVIHGNDHVRMELTRPRTEIEALGIAAQALRRVRSFEARHRLPVGRVMAPPHDGHGQSTSEGMCPTHGPCSELMMSAMRRVGFEAVCYCGPVRDTPGWTTSGWHPADVHLGGGLPGLPRGPLAASADELVLRAVLGQPIILFGHHQDIGRDPDVLDDTAAKVDRLGDVAWASLVDVARGNVAVREEDETLHVRPFSRRFRLERSHGGRHLLVHMPGCDRPSGGWVTVREVSGPGGSRRARLGEPILLPGTSVEVSIDADDAVHAETVPARRPRAWPVVRRCLTEGRDRLLPLM